MGFLVKIQRFLEEYRSNLEHFEVRSRSEGDLSTNLENFAPYV